MNYESVLGMPKYRKEKKKYITPVHLIILSLATNLLLELFEKSLNVINTFYWLTVNPKNFILGTFFILCSYLLFISTTGNFYSGIAAGSVLFSVLGYVNMEKLRVSGAPLYPQDFMYFRYFKKLLNYSLGIKVAMLILFILVLAIFMSYAIGKKRRLKLNIFLRILLLLFTCLVIYNFGSYSQNGVKWLMNIADIDPVLWNQPYNYDTNGFIFGMLTNLQRKVMEAPEDYSEERVLQIAEKYKSYAAEINKGRTASSIKPNIVFILSESFFDPMKLSSLKFSEDPMKNIREIMKQSSSGSLLSPTYGGNTANVEFEALTGFSMSNLLPDAIPYQQSLDEKAFIPSMASFLNGLQYDSTAIHPYNGAYFKRNLVYSTFDFGSFISEKEMKNKDTGGGPYISDQSLMNEILDLLKDKEIPAFIHAVSMQNHLPEYDGKYGQNSISISGLNENNTKEIETYSEGIKQTDLAVKNFIDGIDKLQEPTIVVFYGDHLPALDLSTYSSSGLSSGTTDGLRALHETPLFIYTNFETKKTDLKTISPAFLGVTLSDMLQQPLTPYFALLEKLKLETPGLMGELQIDPSGNIKSSLSKEQEELLKEYKLIQYDLMIGNQYSLPVLFGR